jgi:hypothetical protein
MVLLPVRRPLNDIINLHLAELHFQLHFRTERRPERLQESGSMSMRRATRFRCICEVPPMTLWARL